MKDEFSKVITLTDFKSPHHTLFVFIDKITSIQTNLDGTATVHVQGAASHHVEQQSSEVMRRIRMEQL
jgi:hypothetical protein